MHQLTVTELIEALQALAAMGLENAPVFMSYSYGDYTRTEALNRAQACVFTTVRETAYSATELAIAHEDDVFDEAEDEDGTPRTTLTRAFADGINPTNTAVVITIHDEWEYVDTDQVRAIAMRAN